MCIFITADGGKHLNSRFLFQINMLIYVVFLVCFCFFSSSSAALSVRVPV